jgi:5-methylcytosine-specific restriction endonuclease McrA
LVRHSRRTGPSHDGRPVRFRFQEVLVMSIPPSPLEASVLVLNKMFMAVHVISVRRAFCLLCKQLAEVVSVEDGQFQSYDFETWAELSAYRSQHFRREEDDWIRTASMEIQAPRVIRLLDYDKVPRQTVKFNRRNLFARDHNQCQYCGRKFITSELSLDHVIPRSQGGGTTWENIVCACVECNVRKGGRTPRQANMTLIRKPEKPKRSPVLNMKLTQKKYETWQSFLDSAYWNVELK